MAASAVSLSIGIPYQYIEQTINTLPSIPGRLEQINCDCPGKVLIDYAHTPDAYEQLFASIKRLLNENDKIITVFGCGGDRDRSKRSVMASIAEQYATHSFVTPDNPRNEKLTEINEEIVSGFKKNNFDVFMDREKGFRAALDMAVKNHIVLGLGKGREEYQEIGGKLISYSDINIINEYSHEG